MSIPVYTPPNPLVHKANVDLIFRGLPSIIHLVQGDNSIPVIEVKLYRSGVIFSALDLSPTEINVRCLNADKSTVYTPILGINEDGTSVYVEASRVITDYCGTAMVVIEIKNGRNGSNIINTGPFYINIDKNPAWDNPKPLDIGGIKFRVEAEDEYEIVEYEVIT